MENRIERNLAAWRKQEEQIAALFPASVLSSREYKEQRLKELNKIYFTQRGPLTDAEKLTRRLIDIERKQLERQLYPNVLLRLFRRLLEMPKIITVNYPHAFVLRQLQQRSPDNVQNVRDALVVNGFKNVNADLAKEIAAKKESFTISHSEVTASNKRIDYELNFKKDEQGRYQFTHYDAALKTEKGDSRLAETKRQTFNIDSRSGTIRPEEAINLLEGRSVQKMYFNAEGYLKPGWTKLDFNDRDANGNYKIKQTPESAGYDIAAVLKALPLKDKDQAVVDKLTQQLKNGDRVSTMLEKEGKIYNISLDANPQSKSVNIYNSEHKKVTLPEALGEKKDTAKIIDLKQETKEDQRLNQSRKQGRSIY